MRSAQALQQRSFQNVTGSPSRQHFIQTKLRIGSHDDPLEREADRIAAAVVGEAKVPAIGAGPPNVAQRKCAQCEAEETPVLRKAASTAATSGGAARAASALAQGGVPLTPEQRAYFEPRFGRDFSEVRVHADGSAAEAARAINAHAYTLGRDIAFAEGQFRPGSQEGKRLIAHELAHVIHQADSPRPDATVRRQPTDKSRSKPAFPSSVKFVGCDQPPYTLSYVEQSAINAFIDTSGDCIKNEALRRDILAAYEGLTIVCNPETKKGTCGETEKWARKVNLFKQSLDFELLPRRIGGHDIP